MQIVIYKKFNTLMKLIGGNHVYSIELVDTRN